MVTCDGYNISYFQNFRSGTTIRLGATLAPYLFMSLDLSADKQDTNDQIYANPENIGHKNN